MQLLLSFWALLSFMALHYASELVMRLVLIQPVSTWRARTCFATTLALSMQLFLVVLWDLAVLSGHGVWLDGYLFRAEANKVMKRLAGSPSASSSSAITALASVTAAHQYRLTLFKVVLSLLLVQILLLNPFTVLEFFFASTFTRGRKNTTRSRGGGGGGSSGANLESPRGRRIRLRRSLIALALLLVFLWWFVRAPPQDAVQQPLQGGGLAAGTPASPSAARTRLWEWVQSNEKRRRLLSIPDEIASPRNANTNIKSKEKADSKKPARVGMLGLMQNIQRSHVHAHEHGEGDDDDHGAAGHAEHTDESKAHAGVPPSTRPLTPGSHPVAANPKPDEGVRRQEVNPGDDAEAEDTYSDTEDDGSESDVEWEDAELDEEEDAEQAEGEDVDADAAPPTSATPRPRVRSPATTTTAAATRDPPRSAPVDAERVLAEAYPGLAELWLSSSSSASPSRDGASSGAWSAALRGISSRLATAGVVFTGLLAGYAAFTTPYVYVMPFLYWRGKEEKLRETQAALCKRQRHVLDLYAAKQSRLAQAQYAALRELAEAPAAAESTTEGAGSASASGGGGGGLTSSVKSVWSTLRRAGGKAASSVAAAVNWRRADVVQLASESEAARFLSMTLFLQTDGVGHMLTEARRGNTWVGPLYALLGVLFALYSVAKTAITCFNLLLFRYSTKDSVTAAVDWLHFFVGAESGLASLARNAIQTVALVVNAYMIVVSIRSLLLTLLQLTMSVSGGGVLSRADGFTVVLASCVGTYFVGQLVMLRQQLPGSIGTAVASPPSSSASLSGLGGVADTSVLLHWLGPSQNVLLEALWSLPVHYYQRLNDWSFMAGLAMTAFVRRFILRDPAMRGINAVA